MVKTLLQSQYWQRIHVLLQALVNNETCEILCVQGLVQLSILIEKYHKTL